MTSTNALLWGLVLLAGCLQIKAGYQERQRNTLREKYTRGGDEQYVTKTEFDQMSNSFQSQLNETNKNLQSMKDSMEEMQKTVDNDVTQTEFDQMSNIYQSEVNAVNADVTDLTTTVNKMQERLNTDHCSNSPCARGATCNNRLDDYSCDCRSGFGGKNCDKETGVSDTKVLKVSNGSPEGVWYPWDVCEPGLFARGFMIRLEEPGGDDSSMNNIELHCRDIITGQDIHNIQSGPNLFGTWREWNNCPNGEYLVGFSLKVEPQQGATKDDSSVNGIRMTCSDGSKLTGTTGQWGTFGETNECPKNHYICGVQIRQEPKQGSGHDDSGLNDVVFKCCSWW